MSQDHSAYGSSLQEWMQRQGEASRAAKPQPEPEPEAPPEAEPLAHGAQRALALVLHLASSAHAFGLAAELVVSPNGMRNWETETALDYLEDEAVALAQLVRLIKNLRLR